MRINLLHNKIVMDTITDKFIESFNKNLVPRLEELYPDATEVILYEDYLTDGFLSAGAFFCPLTLLRDNGAEFVFVTWRVDARKFENSVPYAYIGKELIEFDIPRGLPAGFRERLADRAPKAIAPHIAFRIDASIPDKTFLAGKYSESFLEALALFVTESIAEQFSVADIPDSSLELHISFSPMTFMEHVVDNVTYRRLSLSARACGGRDLWVKWTRLDDRGSYSVRDHIKDGDILFEIPDDVPEKIREKEYRYLMSQGSPTAYKNAMSRKSFTEWRELVKRVIKRGELSELSVSDEKTDTSLDLIEEITVPELTFKPESATAGLSLSLDSVLDDTEVTEEDINPDLTALLLGVLEGARQKPAVEEPVADEPATDLSNDEYIPTDEDFMPIGLTLGNESVTSDDELPPFDIDGMDASYDDSDALDVLNMLTLTDEPNTVTPQDEIYDDAGDPLSESFVELTELEAPVSQNQAFSAPALPEEFEAIERENEEMIRLNAENSSLIEQLSLARCEITEKNGEIADLNDQLELQRNKLDELMNEIARLRETVDAVKRAEDRERDRLAELARIAVEEQRSKDIEVDLDAERERQEAARLEAERLERERLEAERLERERLEAERLERERLEAERLAALKQPEPVVPTFSSYQPINYISKTADMIFSHSVDPNIIKRIQKIIVETVEYFGKTDVYMKIRATIPEANIVRVDFLKFPENEFDLITDIIRVLGNSKLGITKVLLD